MDAHTTPSGDLNDLERQLVEWRPAAAGLDADRMVFAAGRASVRAGWGRIGWPIVSGCLALLAGVFGVEMVQERTARLELTAQLQKPAFAPAPSDAPGPITAPSAEPPAADSYLAARQSLAHNIDGWPFLVKVEPSVGLPSPSRPIWKVGSRDDVLEP